MKLSDEEVLELYQKILTFTKRKPAAFFNLRKMHNTVGLCYWTDIELDYRRDIIPTAMHEILHCLYPDWSESKIKYAESRIINSCTSLEIAEFFKCLANKIYKCEVDKLMSEEVQENKEKESKKLNSFSSK